MFWWGFDEASLIGSEDHNINIIFLIPIMPTEDHNINLRYYFLKSVKVSAEKKVFLPIFSRKMFVSDTFRVFNMQHFLRRQQSSVYDVNLKCFSWIVSQNWLFSIFHIPEWHKWVFNILEPSKRSNLHVPLLKKTKTVFLLRPINIWKYVFHRKMAITLKKSYGHFSIM